MAYRGRFAPTPSGPLHFGSVVAALGSWLDARAHGGEWHIRIDDLDPPRIMAGAADQILAELERLGLTWDAPLVFQSERSGDHADALTRLRCSAHVYRCDCSRKQVAAAGLIGIDGPRYPGTCCDRPDVPATGSAWRLDVRGVRVRFDDLLQGTTEQDLETAVGDFVLQRADHVYGYHLACVVDDAHGGFTHVVRGADLLDSTPRQIWLQRLLGLPTPAYLHLPVAVDARGEKLSKQTLATPVHGVRPVELLGRALTFLGHPPPAGSNAGTADELLAWAISRWQRDRLPVARALPAVPDPAL